MLTSSGACGAGGGGGGGGSGGAGGAGGGGGGGGDWALALEGASRAGPSETTRSALKTLGAGANCRRHRRPPPADQPAPPRPHRVGAAGREGGRRTEDGG